MPAETSSLTGALGEMTFERHFIAEGRFMAIPRFDLHKTDFVLEWNGTLVKVQVKTMSQQGESNTFTTTIASSRKGFKGPQPYRAGEIDYFGIVNLKYDHIWMVPLQATNGKTALAWVPPDLRQRKKITAFEWDQYRIK